MKTIFVRFLPAALVFTVANPLFAPFVAPQIMDVNQFKVTVYSQTNSAPPAAPNYPDAYYFGSYIDTYTNADVANVVIYPPAPGTGQLNLIQYGPGFFENGSPYYADESSFDADFPDGTNYDYNYDYTDIFGNVDSNDLYFATSPTNLYPDAVPAFMPGCWTAMQTVDPTLDLTLSWNSYDVTPGADFAYTFINIYDLGTGNTFATPSGPPDETTTNIPANTLEYGRAYEVDLYFSERQTPQASEPEPIKLTAAQIRKSVTPDALISFEDGKPYKTLKRHLTTRGLTLAEYKTKWGLPTDYPTTAPSYSARRSEMAKSLGLGSGGRKSTKRATKENSSSATRKPRGRPPKKASGE